MRHIDCFFRAHTSHPFIAGEPRWLPDVREEDVAELWIREALAGRTFVTRRGGRITIVHPGTRNMHDGPDFLGCVILNAGQLEEGSVEIHRHERDWFRHGHQRNPRYRNVLLHVSLYRGEDTALAARHSIILSDQLRRDLGNTWSGVMTARAHHEPIACAGQIHHVPAAQKQAMLELACNRRFERKVEDMMRRYRAVGGNSRAAHQVLFEYVSRALGYGGNQDLMQRLAESLPLHELVPLSCDERHQVLSTGLEATDAAYARRVRPCNRVRLRLKQLTGAVEYLADRTWLEQLFSLLLAEERDREYSYRGLLRHLVFIHGGPERRKEMLVNVVAPYALVVVHTTGQEIWRSAAIALYRNLFPAPGNHVTRLMAPLLGISSPFTSGQQQGMLELYASFCVPRRCSECLIGTSCP